MSDRSKRELYANAWHGDRPYDQKEVIRLQEACRLFREHAGRLQLERRYSLLDVGCGVGPLRQWLPLDDFHIAGIDISEQAVEIARRHYDVCEVAEVEEPWPFQPESFDGVHAGAIMEHVLDWHAPLNHANRVLRDAGLLVVAVPNLRYWKEIRRLIRGRQPHWLKDMGHIHAYTPKFICSLVSLHGFEVRALEADRVNLPLLPRRSRWAARRFAGLGSVLILAAELRRRVRVEDAAKAGQFPSQRPVGLRSVEIVEA